MQEQNDTQDDRLDSLTVLEENAALQGEQIDSLQEQNDTQDDRLDSLEELTDTQGDLITDLQNTKVNKSGQPYTDPLTGDIFLKPSTKGIAWKDTVTLGGIGNAPNGVSIIYENLTIGTRYRFFAFCDSYLQGFQVKNGTTILFDPGQDYNQGDPIAVEFDFVATNAIFSLEKDTGTGMSCGAEVYALVDKVLNLTKFKEFDGKQNALGFTPENAANKGQPNGYASLDSGGKVPSIQLPSFVDDVLEEPNLASFPTPGETGKIYVALDTNKTYRWSGSTYIEISPSPGSTDSLTEGSVNLYFTFSRVLNSVIGSLTGFLVNSAITATDTVKEALGKLQAQINTKQDSLNYTPEDSANKSTDNTFAANSDTLYPTQKAVNSNIQNLQSQITTTTNQLNAVAPNVAAYNIYLFNNFS